MTEPKEVAENAVLRDKLDTFAKAIAAWNTRAEGERGVITLERLMRDHRSRP